MVVAGLFERVNDALTIILGYCIIPIHDRIVQAVLRQDIAGIGKGRISIRVEIMKEALVLIMVNNKYKTYI